MFNNVFVDFALKHLPREHWNHFSALCASVSVPHITTPLTFAHRTFTLREYSPGSMPRELENRFVEFCYPQDLPHRNRQIEYDRKLYWNNASTFIITDPVNTIAGCVQVIHRSRANNLPVEFGTIRNGNGTHSRLNLSRVYDTGRITEVYHCRRSFALNRIESMNVILMLFKAILAHIIETGTAFSFITYDPSKSDLHSLYVNRLDFIDTDTDLYFEGDDRPWRLLKKDWYHHEQTFAAKGRTQFFMQTWCRNGLRKKHLYHGGNDAAYMHDSNLIDSGITFLTETVPRPIHHHTLPKFTIPGVFQKTESVLTP